MDGKSILYNTRFNKSRDGPEVTYLATHARGREFTPASINMAFSMHPRHHSDINEGKHLEEIWT